MGVIRAVLVVLVVGLAACGPFRLDPLDLRCESDVQCLDGTVCAVGGFGERGRCVTPDSTGRAPGWALDAWMDKEMRPDENDPVFEECFIGFVFKLDPGGELDCPDCEVQMRVSSEVSEYDCGLEVQVLGGPQQWDGLGYLDGELWIRSEEAGAWQSLSPAERDGRRVDVDQPWRSTAVGEQRIRGVIEWEE